MSKPAPNQNATPIGPYNHVAKVGSLITIGATAGNDPATGQLAGTDVQSQTRQILESFKVMLESVGSDLDHVVHVNIFLTAMSDFEAMNGGYSRRSAIIVPPGRSSASANCPSPACY